MYRQNGGMSQKTGFRRKVFCFECETNLLQHYLLASQCNPSFLMPHTVFDPKLSLDCAVESPMSPAVCHAINLSFAWRGYIVEACYSLC